MFFGKNETNKKDIKTAFAFFNTIVFSFSNVGADQRAAVLCIRYL